MPEKNWKQELNKTIKFIARNRGGRRRKFLNANAKMVRRVVKGGSSDDRTPDDGAWIVCNISSAHIPAFCKTLSEGKAYKNGYDLGKYRIGTDGHIPRRILVDQSLPIEEGTSFKEIYFCAVEINGSGIRFYGDLCLVLKRTEIDPNTTVLDRNSYDLLRPPLSASLNPNEESKMCAAAEQLSGKLASDLGYMAGVKVLDLRPISTRRLTTGQISESVLEDEDYLEVLKIGSFGATALEEVRTASADASAEVQIGEKLRLGMTPPIEALLWRKRRHDAEKALKAKKVGVRTVTTEGRTRH